MELSVEIESWPIRGEFSISRGSKTEAEVIVVTIRDGGYAGRGECVPYKRYDETVETVRAQIESVSDGLKSGADRYEMKKLLPAGAARNALDCALWDLEAKRQNTTIWNFVGIPEPRAIPTAYTVAIDTPEKMAEKAAEMSRHYSMLKVKLGGRHDEESVRQIRAAAPEARIVVDANEGWDADNLEHMVRMCESAKVELIEQPLSAGEDGALVQLKTSIRICADESVHTSGDIPELVGRYGAINIKLDKAGGLTEALIMARAAHTAGLAVMVGCHVSTSLSMAPATVVAQYADYVDLDGPLLLERDREPAIEYRDGAIVPTTPALWG